MGELAALGADVVEIAHKPGYLRGRTTDRAGDLIRTGAAHAGMPMFRSTRRGVRLRSLVGQARDGDVVAMMTHRTARRSTTGWSPTARRRDARGRHQGKVLQAPRRRLISGTRFELLRCEKSGSATALSNSLVSRWAPGWA